MPYLSDWPTLSILSSRPPSRAAPADHPLGQPQPRSNFPFLKFVLHSWRLLVLTQARWPNSTPPGGCLRKVVEIIPWDITVVRHAVMPAAAGQQIAVVQAQVKSFLQWLDMMHRQILFQPRHAEGSVTALVAYPAEMEIPSDDPASFFLPDICLSKTGDFTVAMRCRFRLFGADISFRMDPPTVPT